MSGVATRICLGTAQFGSSYGIANVNGEPNDSRVAEILKLARTGGIDTLDTAAGYGDSENRIGRCGGEGFRIISKLPPNPDATLPIKEWVRRSVDCSLARIRQPALHGLLLHRASQLVDDGAEDLYSELLELKASGKVQNIGISIYEPSELDAIIPRFKMDIVQAPINILDTRLEDSGWLDRLSKAGTEIYARSIFLQGLLLIPPSSRPDKFKPWQSLWLAWDEWLHSVGLTALQACIAFVASTPGVHKLVIGVEGVTQLEEILEQTEGVNIKRPSSLQVTSPELLNPAAWASLK